MPKPTIGRPVGSHGPLGPVRKRGAGVPDVLWDALTAEAQANGVSVSAQLRAVLVERYKSAPEVVG